MDMLDIGKHHVRPANECRRALFIGYFLHACDEPIDQQSTYAFPGCQMQVLVHVRALALATRTDQLQAANLPHTTTQPLLRQLLLSIIFFQVSLPLPWLSSHVLTSCASEVSYLCRLPPGALPLSSPRHLARSQLFSGPCRPL